MERWGGWRANGRTGQSAAGPCLLHQEGVCAPTVVKGFRLERDHALAINDAVGTLTGLVLPLLLLSVTLCAARTASCNYKKEKEREIPKRGRLCEETSDPGLHLPLFLCATKHHPQVLHPILPSAVYRQSC
jgi:hypothetical protein